MASSKKRASGELEDGRNSQKQKKKKHQRNAAVSPVQASPGNHDEERAEADVDRVEDKPALEAPGTNGKGDLNEKGANEGRRQRFIVFIGNLPYTATDSSIAAHFAKVKPSQVRHRLEKGTAKSKGFAFLEFGAYDSMKACLKLYHHSLFNDGVSPPRKINVELTAGGGGSSLGRKTKIRTKNDKLYRERQTRALEAKTVKFHGGRGPKDKKEINDGADRTTLENTENSVHPSRRARITS